MHNRAALLLVIVAATAMLISCGGNITKVVHAAGPICGSEFFYNGVQETPDYLWFATDQACDIETPQDQSYTLKFDHQVQQTIVQMGSNMGSIFEWDLIVSVVRPDGRSFSIQQQY